MRPKDSGDVALLMIASRPDEIARVMTTRTTEHPEITQTVRHAAQWLIEMYGDDSLPLRRDAADALAGRFDESTITGTIDTWLTGFGDAIRPRPPRPEAGGYAGPGSTARVVAGDRRWY